MKNLLSYVKYYPNWNGELIKMLWQKWWKKVKFKKFFETTVIVPLQLWNLSHNNKTDRKTEFIILLLQYLFDKIKTFKLYFYTFFSYLNQNSQQ